MILELLHIQKKIRNKPILNDVSISIQKGSIHGLVGPDGAGKTTLIRIATGLMKFNSGSIRFNGQTSENYFSDIGYMPQSYGLYLDLTVEENIQFYSDIHGINRDEAKKRSDQLLKFSKLSDFKKRPTGKLSGGMYKKLALVTVLIHRPKLLILDEPTNGVDPVSRKEFWELIHQFVSEGISCLISTPYVEEISKCHTITMLSEGNVVYNGPASEFPTQPHSATVTSPSKNVKTNVVHIQNLVKTFGNFVAVNRISFSVNSSEIFGFLGANGAGKTTTIRILCGIMPPTHADHATVLGIDLLKNHELVKSHIGYMSQKFSLYHDLTARENLEFYGGLYGLRDHGKKYLNDKIDTVSELTGLHDVFNELVGYLPAGIKQRLSLACAIIHEPRIVFLDEPTAGVDIKTRHNFWNLIRMLKENGTTIFVTTHYMDEAESCDRVAIMHMGNIVALDTIPALKHQYFKDSSHKNPTLEDVFFEAIIQSGEQPT